MVKEKIARLFHSPAYELLRRWLRTCSRSIMAICLLKFLLAGSSLMIPVATRGLIDGAVAGNVTQLKRWAIVLVLTVVGMRALSVCSSFLSIRANTTLQKRMQTSVFKELMHKQYGDIAAYHSGELVSRIQSDVQVVKNGILEIAPGMVSMTVSFFGAAFLLLRIDWHLVALLIAGGLLGLILIVMLEVPLKELHAATQEAEAKYQSSLQETLENLLLVKASGSESRMVSRVGQRQDAMKAAQTKKWQFSAIMNQGINLTFQLSWILCLLWGGAGIYRGTITYGMLAAVLQLVNQIQGPISGIAGIAGQIYSTISSGERLWELLSLPEEREESMDSSGELTELRLQDVQFGYARDTEPVLQNVSCTIHAGDFVAITGISGEGKSTLFRLLLGVYQPDSGCQEVCLNIHGQSRRVPVGVGTRKLFAYVPQGNTLFSGTLRENIAMFSQGAEDSRILEAARIACIEDLIRNLPQGLDTVLGERGIGLSEGQAQRIAIARAILTSAPVLLLDESTSALDAQTEAKLLGNLSRLHGKTCLIVTHRKAALEICDYSLHVERGVMTTQGR